MAKTWFITGASKGFGREWAEAALERGDRVAATSRSAAAFDDLVEKYGDAVLPLRADVADRAAAFEAVQRAIDTFGELDVVVNNAGYGLFGMVEEVSERQARDQIEINVFGALWVTQAVLPTSAPAAPATSSRCPPSAASPHCPDSASTTPPSSPWKASPRASPPR